MDDFNAVDSAALPSTSRVAEVRNRAPICICPIELNIYMYSFEMEPNGGFLMEPNISVQVFYTVRLHMITLSLH